jgi:hypothetical protein
MADKTLELTCPVEFANEVVSKLTLRSPRGKDLRSIKLASFADMSLGEALDIGGRLCGKPPEFMDLLDATDVMKVTSAVFDFLSGIGQKTS